MMQISIKRMAINTGIVITSGVLVTTIIIVTNLILVKSSAAFYTDYGKLATRAMGIVVWGFICALAWRYITNNETGDSQKRKFGLPFFVMYFIAGIVVIVFNIAAAEFVSYIFISDTDRIDSTYVTDHAITYYIFFGGYLCFKLANARGILQYREQSLPL